MRFADPAEAKARAAELSKIVAAWGSLAPAERGAAKPASEARSTRKKTASKR
jgi:hypothetical protein